MQQLIDIPIECKNCLQMCYHGIRENKTSLIPQGFCLINTTPGTNECTAECEQMGYNPIPEPDSSGPVQVVKEPFYFF